MKQRMVMVGLFLRATPGAKTQTRWDHHIQFCTTVVYADNNVRKRAQGFSTGIHVDVSCTSLDHEADTEHHVAKSPSPSKVITWHVQTSSSIRPTTLRSRAPCGLCRSCTSMRNTHAHAESPDSFPRQRLCSQIGRVVGTSDLPHFRSAESECGLERRHQRAEPSRVLFIHESLWLRLCRAPETVRTATPQSHASDTTPRPSDVPLLAVYSSATPLLLAGASAGSFDHDSIRCDPRTSIPATHGQLCRADPRPRRDLIV